MNSQFYRFFTIKPLIRMTFANLLKITHANQGVHDPDANLHCKLDPRPISRNTSRRSLADDLRRGKSGAHSVSGVSDVYGW